MTYHDYKLLMFNHLTPYHEPLGTRGRLRQGAQERRGAQGQETTWRCRKRDDDGDDGQFY